jgi:hypothetical protein
MNSSKRENWAGAATVDPFAISTMSSIRWLPKNDIFGQAAFIAGSSMLQSLHENRRSRFTSALGFQLRNTSVLFTRTHFTEAAEVSNEYRVCDRLLRCLVA